MRRAVLSQSGICGGWRRLSLPALGILLAAAGIRPAFGQPASDAAVEAPVPPAHVRYQLAYRFSPGQQVAYESVHTMKLTTQKGQIVETARNEARTSKHFEVVSVAKDGSALLELTIDHVRMSARFGDAPPVAFDSSKPDDVPPAYRGVMKSVGRPLARARFAADGRLLDSESLLPGEVEREVSGPPPGRESSDDDPNKNFLVQFPKEPQAVGATWTDSLLVPVFVTRTLTRDVKILRRYRLESVDDGVARISVQSAVVTELRDPAVSAQLIQREPAGTIDFDLERGLIVSRTTTIDKTVLAPFGGDTLMHAESQLTERLIESDRVAQQTAK